MTAARTSAPPIARALISVYDKSGLVELGMFLSAARVEILSTGGSAKALRQAGIPVKDVSDHTGFPEIMDGRVKTLHPMIHGGILARRDKPAHRRAMAENAIAPIDLVVSNLYPFEATLASGAPRAACIEDIDIGGPALIRAAAKNADFVAIVTDPADYGALMDEMRTHRGGTTLAFRRRLARAAFAMTAAYDSAIAGWLGAEITAKDGDIDFPPRLILAGARRQELRYGENPHQRAALYAGLPARPGVASARQLQGKELSYNNLNDTDAAFELIAEFDRPAVAIIKHANPCGVAVARTLDIAYARALACDPVSAYGGIIAINRPVGAPLAETIAKTFAEVVIAPSFSVEAQSVFAKRKALRLLVTGAMPSPDDGGLVIKSLAGGFLAQGRDSGRIFEADLKRVTKRKPTKAEMADLLFAFRVVKHVKSNAIVYAKDLATVGIGAGQMSRVDAARIAAWKAREAADAAGEGPSRAEGSVVASDAFFPFADGLLAAVEAGARAVIQPGGSVRDDEIIRAADQHGLAMVFTGMRHFRH